MNKFSFKLMPMVSCQTGFNELSQQCQVYDADAWKKGVGCTHDKKGDLHPHKWPYWFNCHFPLYIVVLMYMYGGLH